MPVSLFHLQIVIFQPLTNANLRLIVKFQVNEVSKRLSERNISVEVTANAEVRKLLYCDV